MGSHNLITDPESIRSNQNGQVTKEQYQSIKDRLSSLPGCVVVGMLVAFLGLAAFLGGKALTQSTPLAILAVVAVILATFAVVSLLGNLLASLRMTKIAVERVSGQVMWDKGRYTAMAGGRLLLSVTGSLDLLPGDYIFYRLAGSQYLLSAQPASAAASSTSSAPPASMDLATFKALLDQPLDFDPRQEPARAADRLVQLKEAATNLSASSPTLADPQEVAELEKRMAAQLKLLVQGQNLPNLVGLVGEAETGPQPRLDHDGLVQLIHALDQVGVRRPGELSANANGKQTSAQRQMLTKGITSNLAWSAVIGIGWLVLLPRFIQRGDWLGLLGTSAFFAIILLVILSGARKELSDLLSGTVQVEEGWVTKFSHTDHSSKTSQTHYFYQVNQHALEISQSAYNALVEGNYRVCFMPNTRTLVNIDPLPDFST
jgi:hypothetical protein